MSYEAALKELTAMTPELAPQPGVSRRKFSLVEIGMLLKALDEPQKKFKSVLIAGTNGKGSTAAALASILNASGVRTGLYTSPHLERVNERIRIGGVEIADERFGELFFRVMEVADKLIDAGKFERRPSFFETLTAIGFLHFAESGVEIAVLEVGLGGRLDATNIVEPMLSIITDISLDHMEWLGKTIPEIAREKAGILRRDGILVTLPQIPAANQVLGEVAMELNVRGVSATEFMPAMGTAADGPYPLEILGEQVLIDSPLTGSHQLRNRALAIAAAVVLKEEFAIPVIAQSIGVGIHKAQWPARLEKIADSSGTTWILDVAHNPAGAWALRAGLNAMEAAHESDIDSEFSGQAKAKTLIFSCLSDKPVNEMGQILFPLFDRIYFVPIHSARATTKAQLMAAAEKTGSNAQMTASVEEAIALAASNTVGGEIVIAGSFYLVGEARGYVLKLAGKSGL